MFSWTAIPSPVPLLYAQSSTHSCTIIKNGSTTSQVLQVSRSLSLVCLKQSMESESRANRRTSNLVIAAMMSHTCWITVVALVSAFSAKCIVRRAYGICIAGRQYSSCKWRFRRQNTDFASFASASSHRRHTSPRYIAYTDLWQVL